jgi:hypothetical protein
MRKMERSVPDLRKLLVFFKGLADRGLYCRYNTQGCFVVGRVKEEAGRCDSMTTSK